MGHVSANIGGRFVTYKSIEQEGPVYEAVPKDRQKKALNFLNDNLFKKPSWLVDVPYIYTFSDNPDSYLYTLVNNVISSTNLLNTGKLNRLGSFAQHDASNYKPEEYLSDLTGMIFEELGKGKAVDSYRRYLQRRYVTAALETVTGAASATTDARALVTAQLMDIQKKAAKAKSSDAVTKAHWQGIASQIENGLKAVK